MEVEEEIREEDKSQSVAVAEIRHAQRFILNFGYYLRLFPVRVDKETGLVHPLHTKSSVALFVMVQCTTILNALAITGGFILNVWRGRINFTTSYDWLHADFVAGFIFTSLFLNVHTIWKRKELIPLMNNFNLYFEKFHVMVGENSETKPKVSYGKLMKLFFWVLTSLQLGAVLGYIASCETHYNIHNFHICDESVIISNITGREITRWSHASYWKIPVYAVLQSIGNIQQTVAVQFYIAFVIPVILPCVEMQTTFGAEDVSYFCNHENWIRHYHTIQVLMAQINECLQEVMMPVHSAAVMSWIVLLNYVIIRYEMNLALRITLAIINLILFGYLVIFFDLGTRIPSRTAQALALRKRMPDLKKYVRLELESLDKLRVRIGATHYLDDCTKLTAYMAVIDYSVNALLTF